MTSVAQHKIVIEKLVLYIYYFRNKIRNDKEKAVNML